MLTNKNIRSYGLYTRYLGGYSVGVPPLPIPNREVKPDSADGTASSGRVGRRQLKPTPDSLMSPGFFIV